MSFDTLLNDYKTRLSATGLNIRSQQINSLKNGFLDGFKDNINYRKVKYKKRNSQEHFFLDAHVFQIKSITEAIDMDNYKKIIFRDMNFIPNRGDLLRFESQDWIVLTLNTIDFIKSCVVGMCENTIKLYKDDVLYEYPILVEDQVRLYQLGIDTGKYFTEPISVKVFRIPADEITKNIIERGQIYKIGMSNYKIIDVDDILNPGLLVVKLEFSQVEQTFPDEDDNGDNTNDDSEILYEIDGDNEIYVGDIKFYNAIKYVDGNIDDAGFIFSIANDVQNNKYKLTIIDMQNCSIEAKEACIIILRATDSGSDEYVEKEIILKNLF